VTEGAQWLTPWAVLQEIAASRGDEDALRVLLDYAVLGKVTARAAWIEVVTPQGRSLDENREVSEDLWQWIGKHAQEWCHKNGDYDLDGHKLGIGWVRVAIRGLRIDPASVKALVCAFSSPPSAAPEPPVASGKAKRPRAPRGHRREDEPLVAEMRAIILGEKINPWPAAMRVVDRAAGGGLDDAKAKRLVARYYEAFPQQPSVTQS
jgi:hypothetical protein